MNFPCVFAGLLVMSLSFASASRGHSTPNEKEKKLIKKLLFTYDKTVRPVDEYNQSVQLKIDMALRQIIDVDERNQVLHSNVWIRQYWSNPFFRWNRTEFGGIRRVNMDPSLMWLPDTVLYNNIEISRGANLDKILQTRVTVEHTGNIQWLSPAILSSTCDIDVRYFPFDEQFCKMVFASWTYNGWELNVSNHSPKGDIKNYIKNTEWHLIDMAVERKEMVYSCCVEPYPTLTFIIHLRRRPLYYLTNLVIPCGIIMLTALLSFYAPPESGERIGLVITTLLAMTVFMLLVAEAMPATSEVIPLVAKFYIVAMVVIAFNLAATCLCVKFFYMDPAHYKMPEVMRVVLVDWLAPLLGLHSPNTSYSLVKNSDTEVEMEEISFDANSSETISTKNESCTTNPKSPTKETCKFLERHDSFLRKIMREVKVISNKFHVERKRDTAVREWRVAARVLDVVFFVAFLLVIIIASITIFSEAPSLQLK